METGERMVLEKELAVQRVSDKARMIIRAAQEAVEKQKAAVTADGSTKEVLRAEVEDAIRNKEAVEAVMSEAEHARLKAEEEAKRLLEEAQLGGDGTLMSGFNATQVMEEIKISSRFKRRKSPPSAPTPAMHTVQNQKLGGIDLTSQDFLRVRNNNGTIKFQLDPAMSAKMNKSFWRDLATSGGLAQLQKSQGFSPDITNIQPMNDLKGFLGVKDF